ncbi:right-handed parallel beta-helix repeat-containing protein [Urechidicola croceus]|uniref:Right handed beta helix domain-containing protein n=1 Tax=Urechidicola croceus TaxID=1850246 RepID=A0A1D8P564_9FLAO|nr:hypothetical protein [Urechidicola croceus]AOW19661.1 hypothetical protein LPB138_02740 [Urechidicola croceus]
MKTLLTLLTFCLVTSLSLSAQNVLTVDNTTGSNAQYSDLQTAVSVASANDTIYVHSSETNYGNITLTKPLNIIGFGHAVPDKRTYITSIDLNDGSDNSYFSGLNITSDVTISSSNATVITGLVFENNFISGLYIGYDLGSDNVLIRGNIIGRIGYSSTYSNYTNTIITNNIIFDYITVKYHQSVTIKNNIFLNEAYIFNYGDNSGDLTVQNNIFYGNSNSNFNYNRDGVIFENCMTYNVTSSVTELVGTNNLNDINPNFVMAADDFWNPEEDDYHLQAGSLAIGAGVDGEDLGIYDNGSFLFNNFGYTNGVPTVKITSISSSIAPGDNLEVTISTTSN